MSGRKAVFVDLFGTLVEDHGVAEKVIGIKFKPGAVEALKRLEDAGYLAFVSICHENIPVPGAEYVQDLEQRVRAYVGRNGVDPASLHFIGADEQTQPLTAKALKALAEARGLDLHRCVIVGDLMADVQIGRAVGAVTVLLSSEDDSPGFENAEWIEPDYVVADLDEAARKFVCRRT